MPNRPKPRPASTPQAFDIFKPGKGRPSATSRPVIVSNHPGVQDHTLVEKKGAPVANAHQTVVPVATTPPHPAAPAPAPAHPKPVLKSLQPQSPHPATPKAPTPATSSVHIPTAHHVPRTGHAPKAVESAVESATKKVSRHGVTIAPPSASAAHKVHPVSAEAKPPADEPAEPQLAALPITPMEQLSGSEAKVEGKEELLAAMPIEIRRTIASTSGQQASEWNVPDFSAEAPAPAAPTPEAQAPASPAETPAAAPAADTPATPPVTEPAPAPPQPATPEPKEQVPAAPAADAKAATSTAPMSSSQAAAAAAGKSKRSEAAVFIIMFVLFLLLGTLVVLLFLSGSIAL